MSWFSNNSNKDRVSIILDIGSSSIGAAFVKSTPHQKPIILYSKRFPISTREKPRSTELVELMIKTLKVAIADLAKQGVKKLNLDDQPTKPSQVFVVLAAPWYSPDVKNITHQDKNAVTIDQALISRLIDQELGGYIEQFSKSHLEVIEKHVMGMTLNGYHVTKPFGKKASKIDLRLFLSAVPQSITEAIRKQSGDIFNIKKVLFATFPLVAYTTIINLFQKEDNFVLMDVTGEVTDISIVENDMLIDNASFPSGKNLPIRRLAKEFDVSPEIAVSFIKLYLEKQAQTEVAEKIKTILNDTQNEWLIYLNQTISDLSNKHNVPAKLFMTIDNDIAALFADTINKNKESSESKYRPQSLTLLDHQTIGSHITIATGEPHDSFIALIASYLDLMENQSSQH